MSPPEPLSPMKRNPQGKYVLSGQKEMIINLYKQLKQRSPDMKYVAVINSLSESTGIGKTTIMKTIAVNRRTGTLTSPNMKRRCLNILEKTSDAHLLAIRRKVHEFWIRREVPNLDKVLLAINTDEELPTFSRPTLHRLLKRMEFRFMRRKRNSAMTEKGHIIARRQRYIRTIRKLREEGRKIYYLDETWYNSRDCGDRSRVDTSVGSSQNGKGKQLIIGNIGSEDGFLPEGLLCFESKKGTADYHDEMNGDTFFKWVENITETLPAGAVIVMDDAPYHSVLQEHCPTKAWKKADILEWLVGKGEDKIELEDCLKCELVSISQKYKDPENKYFIDNYLKGKGFLVLRLPPYHSEFNPIELVWAQIKRYVRQRNTTCKLEDIRLLVEEAIENVSPANWANYVEHIKKEEEKLYQMDRTIDAILEEDGWVSGSDNSDTDE